MTRTPSPFNPSHCPWFLGTHQVSGTTAQQRTAAGCYDNLSSATRLHNLALVIELRHLRSSYVTREGLHGIKTPTAKGRCDPEIS